VDQQYEQFQTSSGAEKKTTRMMMMRMMKRMKMKRMNESRWHEREREMKKRVRERGDCSQDD